MMLSKRALDVLTILSAAGEEADLDEAVDLVSEGRVVWLGNSQLRWSTLWQLLECVAITETSDEGGSVRRYNINTVGRAIVRRPELADEVKLIVRAGRGAFTIGTDDRIHMLSSGTNPLDNPAITH